MRAHALMVLAATLMAGGGCVPDPDKASDPDWMKPPEAYQPVTAELTFNKANFEKFNMMSDSEQETFLAGLKEAKGTFKGQAMSKTGAGLSEGFEGFEHGDFELNALTEAILYEITIDYKLYTTRAIGKTIAPNRYVEFTGTLVGVDFQNSAKPRKIVLQVACDTLAPIKG